MKLKMFFCVIALMFCMLTSNAFALNFSQQQAYLNTRALYMNPSNVDFYVASVTDFTNEDGICNIDSATLSSHPALVSAASKWLVFVDEEPLKAWPHNCSYYYYTKTYFPVGLNFNVDQIKVIGQMPPNIKMTPKSVQNRYDESMCGAPSVPNILLHRKYSTTNTAAPNTHVLLINASPTPVSNYQRYWNDLSYLYTVLTRRYGISKDNIDILCSDGTDPDTDMYDGADGLISSSNDFDNDGVDEDVYSAHKQCLQQLMYNYAEDLGEDDNLLIFITGCGAKLNNAPFIWMWNNEKLYSTEFATMLNSLDVNTINMVFGFCFSGQFADVLEAPGRVITSACEGHSDLWPLYDRPYTSFTYHWTSAINMMDLDGNTVYTDHNNNGMVSMEEAFMHADSLDVEEETSAIASNPVYVKCELSMLHYPPAVDLFMRDTLTDVGDEPNLACNEVFWDSPDLWMRDIDDGGATHQNPTIGINQLYNKVVFVYGKVFNRGWKPFTGSGKYWHVYWLNESLSANYETWMEIDLDDPNSFWGDHCFSQVIGDQVRYLAPNSSDSVIIKGGWLIPTHLARDAQFNRQGKLQVSLLSNLNSTMNNDSQYKDKWKRYVDNLLNILGSNDLVLKNASIHSSIVQDPGIPVLFMSTDTLITDYNIEFLRDQSDPNSQFFANTETSISLSPSLYNNWQLNGSIASNVTTNSSDTLKFRINNLDSKICKMSLDSNQIDSIKYSFNLIANEFNSEPHHYKFHIIQRNSATGVIVGGKAFEIFTEGRSPINAVIRQEIEDGRLVLIADNINEEVDYEWYDSNGQVVGKERTLILNHKSKASEYRLRVIAKKDHAVNYTTIQVETMPAIANVSPNPFNGHVSLKLTEPAMSGTTVRLTSVATGSTLDYNMLQGESDITIYTSQLPHGMYVISLLVGGDVIESHQIVK